MCNYTDAEWIRLLKQTPRAADVDVCLWEDFYKFCWFQVRKAGFDEQLATDCAVETFHRVVKGAASFRLESSFRTWWRVIASNVVRTHLERARKRERREEPLPEIEDIKYSQLDNFTNLAAGTTVILQRLWPCLQKLPKRQREVIFLRYLTVDADGELSEQSPEDIAGTLGITKAAVAVASAHARSRLRLCLESLGYDGPDDILAL
jgi:RNA polymerase sigma factor (sigma-70 family)